MVKILSQSGMSLADVYNVSGSIAGVESLDSREVQLVHEMGGTIFSERFGTAMQRANAAGILQSAEWDITFTGFGASVVRLLGITVFASTAARVSFCMLAIRDAANGREVPIFYWNSTVDDELPIELDDEGGGVSTRLLLRPVVGLPAGMPNMLTGEAQNAAIGEIVFRGTTLAFGAGSVSTRAVIHSAFSGAGGLSAVGLPIPGW